MNALQTSFSIWFQKIILGIFSEKFIIFCSRWVPWIFGAVLIVLVMYQILYAVVFGRYHHFHKFFFGLLATFLIALVTQWLMKMMFSYGRPFTAGLHSLYEYGGYDTFPSGHAMIFMALSVFILHQNTGWGMICIGLTLVIGLARIAVGIHWPIDIIGGFIIGALISYGMIFVTKMI